MGSGLRRNDGGGRGWVPASAGTTERAGMGSGLRRNDRAGLRRYVGRGMDTGLRRYDGGRGRDGFGWIQDGFRTDLGGFGRFWEVLGHRVL